MVKQTKTFKKGNVTKKALSAILAASMVMTSSSFVMAEPVAVEDITPAQVAAAEEVAVGTETPEDMDAVEEAPEVKAEENVGTDIYVTASMVNKAVYTGNEIKPTLVLMSGGSTLVENTDYKLTYKNNTNVAAANAANAPRVCIEFIGNYNKAGDSINLSWGTKTISKDNVDNFALKFAIEAKDVNSTDITLDTANYTPEVSYTGSKQLPTGIVVKDGTKELVQGTDYAIELKNDNIETADGEGISARGTYEVILKGLGNYGGEKVTGISFEITKLDFNETNATVVVEDVKYQANTVGTPNVIVKDKTGTELKAAKFNPNGTYKSGDYVVKYVKNLDTVDAPWGSEVGEYDIKIYYVNPKGDYKETTNTPIVKSYKVVANSLAQAVKDAEFSLTWKGSGKFGTSVKTAEYNGKVQAPTAVKFPSLGVTVSANNKLVTTSSTPENWQATDRAADSFDLVFPDAKEFKNAGTYEIKVIGKNEYKDQEATIAFRITPKELDGFTENSNGVVENSSTRRSAFEYAGVTTDGNAIRMKASIPRFGNTEKPYVDIKFDGYQLVEDTDFTAKVNTVLKTVTVTGKGNFKTATPVVFSYVANEQRINLNDSSITAVVNGTYAATGSQVRPADTDIVLTEAGPNGSYTLQQGFDYKISGYGENKEGTGYVDVEAMYAAGNKNYTGTRRIYFAIGENEVATVYRLDDSKLDKTVAYDKAEHKATVYGVDTSVTSDKADIKVKKVSNNAYAAAADIISVKYLRDGKITTDFKTPGTITVEIQMKNYKGVLSTSYTIIGKVLSDAITINYDIPDQTYTGKEITPVIEIKEKNGYEGLVKEGRDYKITYVNNVERGQAYAVVEGIGNYSGKYYVPFNIVGQEDQTITVLAAQARDIQSRTLNSKPTVVKFEAGKAPKTAVTYESSDEDVVKVDETGKITYTGLGEATITIKAAETAEYKAAEATMTVKVGLAKPSFTPFSKNNAFTLTSSTVKGAEKFEVQYATKKDFSNKKSEKFKATSGKVRQVKVSAGDKKTYYVRVRAISGTETSEWSKVKTVATK